MEILQIKNDNVYLLFHSSEAAEVGENFRISLQDAPEQGIIIQVISNDSHEYSGITQELMQRILESRLARTEVMIDRELGLDELRNLKVAKAKIRKRIQDGTWVPWDGWIPTRNVIIESVSNEALISNVLPDVLIPVCFMSYRGNEVNINGPLLDKVNVITGVKGSGKSHLSKHLVLQLSTIGIPCIIFDINGEYLQLPNIIHLRWGETYLPDLAQMGPYALIHIVRTFAPLPEASANEFEHRIIRIFDERQAYAAAQGRDAQIDLDYLIAQGWSNNDYINRAIRRRLERINGLGLFRSGDEQEDAYHNFRVVYDLACSELRPIVVDLRDQTIHMQNTLSSSILKQLENICRQETTNDTCRYPFVFFEEAHFYVEPDDILDIITRGRHIGLSSVFVTNSPQKLPDTVFRQLDNLFLQTFHHKDDIRMVSKNSFTDEETIDSFATRMLPHHALMIGQVTQRYPIICRVNPLPAGIPPTGVTRNSWDRIIATQRAANSSDSDERI
jgi:hypothetical protein